MQQRSVYRLTESALMLAIAAALSVVKIVDMPVGGSVTLMSMLPIILIAYRYGTRWGLLTGFTYGLIQMLLGLENLSYATSFGAAVAIILFDYVIAFLVLGLGGIFRKAVPNQGVALALGAVFTGVLRFVCHFISGCTVWYGLSIPSGESMEYSVVYNAVYMIPEILLLVVGALYLSRVLNFRETNITRAPAAASSPLAAQLSAVGAIAAIAAVVADIAMIVPNLQTEDELFTLAGLAEVEWAAVVIVTVLAAAVTVACQLASKKLSKNA